MEVRRTLLVDYPVEHIFDVIEQAEHYPRFLPWCASATIVERSDDIVTALIRVDYHRIRFSFVTRNPKRRPYWLGVRLQDGPFRRFEGDWHFTPLTARACKVEFNLHCELSDWFSGRLAAPVFEHVTTTFVDAFVKRAERTYSTLVAAAPVQALEPAATSGAEPQPAPAATASAATPEDKPAPAPEQTVAGATEVPSAAPTDAAPDSRPPSEVITP
jgi:ribosome-associated toxin RatA of RatAB toxin-antitoxin module